MLKNALTVPFELSTLTGQPPAGPPLGEEMAQGRMTEGSEAVPVPAVTHWQDKGRAGVGGLRAEQLDGIVFVRERGDDLAEQRAGLTVRQPGQRRVQPVSQVACSPAGLTASNPSERSAVVKKAGAAMPRGRAGMPRPGLPGSATCCSRPPG